MEVITKPPTVKGPTEMFTGDAYFDVIVKGEEPSRMRANTVRFALAPAPLGTPMRWDKPFTSPRASV